ncbi:Aste57867_9691 [Aphanomyces stellatus]|uniref:Aste57867_9691 protein n=1 Tax=Aphanomyces stellatus TaxID=120398 RepID=A0A485KNH7_9STRA|nr:hypothetical protein As57867_009653 [Aphanomyces stellatus]VFT86570.1 Aste57867_9691 [Aphanomyces stellatus]
MEEVGFWRKSDADPADLRPHPQALQDKTWYMENKGTARQLIAYVRYAGCVESYEMGYSFCRIDPSCPSKVMGACTLTDGVYCWPEGYAHYLEQHHVRPPEVFLAHVLSRPVPSTAPKSGLLMWDFTEKQPVQMPAAMQEMVLANTTLTLDGGPSTSSPATATCVLL